MTDQQGSSQGYKPIADYAAIGNLRTAALVGRDGSIDWCCFPHLDSPSVFAAILDARKGGRFRVWPEGAGTGDQDYIESTNVLKTRFQSGRGMVTVTDFMPLWGDIHGFGESYSFHQIHRVIECKGRTDLLVEWSPRFDYARARTRISRKGGEWLAEAGRDKLVLCGLEEGEVEEGEFGPVLRARLGMEDGERRVLLCRWGTEDLGCSLGDSLEMLARTINTWYGWAHQEAVERSPEWAGKHLPMLIRSELVLKLLTDARTGAIAAAPTTSLPEEIGGVRNWDYRYAWIRDASLIVQALISMGHKSDALEFLYWMERVSESHFEKGDGHQVMYRLDGSSDLEEHELHHLEGYMGSRPVRIGNGAAEQFQLEIYGEIIGTGYELARRGEKLEPHLTDFLSRVADHVCMHWKKPDRGIWEIRGEPRHLTYSKVMAWVALDRAVALSERYGLKGDVDKWRRNAEEIREQVLEHGFDRAQNSFVVAFDSNELDAATLRIPLLEFLPFDDPRVQGTIDRILEVLTRNRFVYRYLYDDGLPGEEGAFGLCTFWLVDALALSGRLDEAWEIFEGMVERANHVGLFSEEFDVETGEFLGNFPQGFTHIGLINSALYLAYAEGRPVTEPAPIGSQTHRAEFNR